MESNQLQSATMKTLTFDIRVALVGYVSVGKSTVLNALLGEKFSQVASKRTTVGINFFRIHQPAEHRHNRKDGGIESADDGPEQEWSTVCGIDKDNDGNHREAVDVHEEISKDNQELRSGDTVEEKTFDIQISHPICKMRGDTQLVLIDIPGINEAESSKKYKDYVEYNWKTFDCVVVVMDAIQGVNTEEQVDLLKFVRSNNRDLKDIPTIVLGNKVDDFFDEDTIHLIEETYSKTTEIFGNVDCCGWESALNAIGSTDEVKPTTSNCNTNESVANTAFIPISAKNAFTYMKAGSITLDQVNDPKYLDLINKIGHDECGRKWSRMKPKDKVDAVMAILGDPSELEERLAGTKFDIFLETLSTFIGGDEKQQTLLAKQLDVELKDISHDPLGEQTLSESISKAFQKYQSSGRTDVDKLKNHFWKAYKKCEDRAFGVCLDLSLFLKVTIDPSNMERPFMELEKYHELSSELQWAEECVRVIHAMKSLLHRQLSILLLEFRGWSFNKYCLSAGGGIKMPTNRLRCDCDSNEAEQYCYQIRKDTTKSKSYFVCGEMNKISMEKGWKVSEDISWSNLSPQDWIIILDSLALVWNSSHFIEDFGPEKAELNAALMMFHGTFGSISGISLESSVSTNPINRLFLHAYKEEINRNGKKSTIFETKFKMPSSLADPSHWGSLAWKYTSFRNRQKFLKWSLQQQN